MPERVGMRRPKNVSFAPCGVACHSGCRVIRLSFSTFFLNQGPLPPSHHLALFQPSHAGIMLATTSLVRRVGLLGHSKALAPSCRLFSTTLPIQNKDLRPASTQIFTPDEVQAGIAALSSAGYDASTVWEQRVVWGDHDQFQHVNNVHFVRWFESARMFFANTLAKDFTPQRQEEVNRGTGKSFILAGINVRYRRPVLYPDTVSSALLPV